MLPKLLTKLSAANCATPVFCNASPMGIMAAIITTLVQLIPWYALEMGTHPVNIIIPAHIRAAMAPGNMLRTNRRIININVPRAM